MTETVLELPRAAESAALARSFAREHCVSLTAEEMTKAELLVSELVTNAIRHGEGRITLRFSDPAEGLLRIEVHDDGEVRPHLRDVRPEVPGGRGLHIVDGLASAWGFNADGVGKTVWLELVRASTEPAQAQLPFRRGGANISRPSAALGWSVASPLIDILEAIRGQMKTDTATVLLVDSTRKVLEPTATVGLDRTVRGAPLVPVGRGFAGRVAQSRQPVILDHVSRDNVLNPVLLSHGLRSLLGVPILVDSELLGVLHVGCRDRRDFDPIDVQNVCEAAAELGKVLQRRSVDQARAAAVTLQRGLLPSSLQEHSGLEIAARYVPADGDLGGDWYDVFDLPGDRLAVAIGDVVGHGLDAAVVMGRLRSALRAYALDYEDPADVVQRLDRTVRHFEPNTFATVLYGVTAPPFEEWHFTSAGHFVPIVAGPQGCEMFDMPVDRPLGLSTEQSRRTTQVVLPVGATMCLFTDGLVERRPSPDEAEVDIIGLNIRRLEAVLREVDDPEVACMRMLTEVVGDDIVEDDIALMAVRRSVKKTVV